jgi:hypothetical protein
MRTWLYAIVVVLAVVSCRIVGFHRGGYVVHDTPTFFYKKIRIYTERKVERKTVLIAGCIVGFFAVYITIENCHGRRRHL